ncbi:MAG: Mur ligase domain-containing protein, partial [Fidelibacterota bacterium]
MKLKTLIENIDCKILGDPDIEISGISNDSRSIKEGEIFVAVKGEIFDGHDFLKEAVKKGA